jgi:hypothetical protein
MRRTTLFALILLSTWSASAAAQSVVLSVAEERLKRDSPLWMPDGALAHALATAGGLYRPLAEGSRVRFVTQDTLQIGQDFNPRWDPLRGPRPASSFRAVLSESVTTIFLDPGSFVRRGRVTGSGERVVGFVGIDTLYHAVPNGKVWLAEPRSFEFVSMATGDSVRARRVVPRDSVVAIVLGEGAPEADNNYFWGIVALASLVGFFLALSNFPSD